MVYHIPTSTDRFIDGLLVSPVLAIGSTVLVCLALLVIGLTRGAK